MPSKDEIKKAIEGLFDELKTLNAYRQKNNILEFDSIYQPWYTKALRVIKLLAPDRYDEFVSYYLANPKRKTTDIETYVIQDFVRGMSLDYGDKNEPKSIVAIRLWNQENILRSLFSRIDGVLANLELTIVSEIEDAQLAEAESLKKVNLRAAGALAGVILEDHLQRVAANHNLTLKKKDPTIADLNDHLKNNGIYEVSTWRKIQF